MSILKGNTHYKNEIDQAYRSCIPTLVEKIKNKCDGDRTYIIEEKEQ